MDEHISPAEIKAEKVALGFNPHWRCLMNVMNQSESHWVLSLFLRHGATMEKTTIFIFDSLNIWKTNDVVRDMVFDMWAGLHEAGLNAISNDGTVPHIVNGFKETIQTGGTACGLHCVETANIVIRYMNEKSRLALKQREQGQRGQVPEASSTNFEWKDFDVADFRTFVEKKSPPTSACRGYVQKRFKTGIEFLVIYAYYVHILSSGAYTEEQFRKDAKKDRQDALNNEEYDVSLDVSKPERGEPLFGAPSNYVKIRIYRFDVAKSLWPGVIPYEIVFKDTIPNEEIISEILTHVDKTGTIVRIIENYILLDSHGLIPMVDADILAKTGQSRPSVDISLTVRNYERMRNLDPDEELVFVLIRKTDLRDREKIVDLRVYLTPKGKRSSDEQEPDYTIPVQSFLEAAGKKQ